MLKKETLPKHSFKLLQEIASIKTFEEFYLAGGTALALQIGHRESIDLDFFTGKEFKTAILSKFPTTYQVVSLNDNSIELIAERTKVFFFYFAFPLYKDLINVEGIRFADPVDIGLMKLLALQGRTTRKDIIDLYFIDKEIMPLEELLQLFEKHYPSESFNSYNSLKTILSTSTLENQPMPKMMKEVNWDECLELVTRKVTGHIKNLLETA
jgi:hypothetical protein